MKPFGLILLIATALFPAYQLFSLPGITDQIALFSQYLGLAALVLMAWAMVWATRMPGVEAIFGGLDRVYVLHKWSGIVALAAVIVHDTVDADIRGGQGQGGLNNLAETMGEFSLYGLIALVVISVATFIPYHLWKWTHKAMGALFILGALHFALIDKPFAMTDPAGLYTGLFCIAGTLAYLWTLLPEAMRPSKGYTISKIEKTGGALAVSLAPDGRGMAPEPGQFGVIRFTGSAEREPHPFSFSQIGPDGALRVTVKGLGDFTNRLGDALEVGQAVRVQGPFGRFRLHENAPQVWVAGGIGITPFLAWAEALSPDAKPVHLFYCIRSRDDAPHLAEIEALAAAKPNLTLHLMVSGAGQRLTADHIAETVGKDLSGTLVSFCGPTGLRRALQSGLRRYGVTPKRFHYEEFEFRTGIGLKRLAAWIMDRARSKPEEARA